VIHQIVKRLVIALSRFWYVICCQAYPMEIQRLNKSGYMKRRVAMHKTLKALCWESTGRDS